MKILITRNNTDQLGQVTGRRKALVIAISEYDDKQIPSLEFCRNDGEAMYSTLVMLGYEVTRNHIGALRGEEFRDAITDFFQNEKTKPADTLLFYFSGHGLLDPWGSAYFGTTDVNPRIPEKRGIRLDFLREQMERSVSSKAVAILDCNYSEFLTKGLDKESCIPGEEAEKIGKVIVDKVFQENRGISILASSLSGGSYIDTEKKMSTFTYYIIRGLRGNGDSVDKNGFVTLRTLYEYAYSEMLKSGPSLQRPIAKYSNSGEIILASYPSFQLPKKSGFEEKIQEWEKHLQEIKGFEGRTQSKLKSYRMIRILFLPANPKDMQLELVNEIESIDRALQISKFRDFDLQLVNAASILELQVLLAKYEPHIVHFSGHDKENALQLPKEDGSSEIMPPEVLTHIFKIANSKKEIQIVVLNRSYSEKQAGAIAKSVPCVIGIPATVSDMASIKFVTNFYRALNYGRSVGTAFALARNELFLENIPQEWGPTLRYAPGVDPSKVFLVKEQPSSS